MDMSTMPRFCKKCGNALPLGQSGVVKFCSVCGNPISMDGVPPQMEIKYRNNVFDEAKIREEAYRRAQAQLKKEKELAEKKLWDKILKIVGIVCLSLALIAVILIICKQIQIAVGFVGVIAFIFATLTAAWYIYSARRNEYTEVHVSEDKHLFGLISFHEVHRITCTERIKEILKIYGTVVLVIVFLTFVAIYIFI